MNTWTSARSLLPIVCLCAMACGDDDPAAGGGSGAGSQGGAGGQASGGNQPAGGNGGNGGGGANGGGDVGGSGGVAMGGGGSGGGGDVCELSWSVGYSVDTATAPLGVAVASTGEVVIAGAASQFENFLQPAVGYFARPFVALLSATGQPIWFTEAAASNEAFPAEMVLGNDDTIYVVGTFDGTLTIDGTTLTANGFRDIYLMALGLDGSVLWHKQFGTVGAQRAVAMALAPNGDLVIGAQFDGTVDFGGGPLTSTFGEDIAIARLSADGDHVASIAFGTAEFDWLHSLDVGPNDKIIIGAERLENFMGSDFVAAYDADLTGELWHHDYAIGEPQVAVHANGDISVVGLGLAMRRLDANGNELSAALFDAGVFGIANLNVAASGDGGLWVLGTAQGTVDLGGGPMTVDGDGDAMVALYDAAWNPVFSEVYPGGIWADTSAIAPIDPQTAVITGLFEDGLTVCPTPLVPVLAMDGFVAKLAL